MQRGIIFFLTALLVLFLATSVPGQHASLEKQGWIHGSENCLENHDSLIQVVRYNENTWILRQNKCIHYEAPFMFLFLGKERALLVDTGATEDESKFPLYRTVLGIITRFESKLLPLVVVHTHRHHDHFAGDGQFIGKPNITVIPAGVEEHKKYFGISHWPQDQGQIDLGKRVINIIAIPGHQESSIALYDRATHLLLTGDTFYPGRLYVEDWSAFRESIARLSSFAENNEVTYILGNHIEMSDKPGVDYPTGSTWQPREQALPLTIEDLQTLAKALARLGNVPTREVHDKFIIYPK